MRSLGADGPRDEPDANRDGQAGDERNHQKDQKDLIHNRVPFRWPRRFPARSSFRQPNFHAANLRRAGVGA